MDRKFQPSALSSAESAAPSDVERAIGLLQFIQASAASLEKEIKKDGAAPAWLIQTLGQSAGNMQVAAGYSNYVKRAKKK